jgi:multidrug efflux system outer membrane protein
MSPRSFARWAAWVGIASLASGCASLDTKASVRQVELPASFDGGTAGPSVGSLGWRDYFADPLLVALVEEALSANHDRQAALQRIEVARASASRASGALWPQVSARVGAALRRYGRYTMDGAGNATTDITPGQLVPEHLPDLLVGFEATWEADITGRLGRARGAAQTRLLASVEVARLVTTSIVAELGSAYYDLVALDELRTLVAEAERRQVRALEMLRVQKEAGRADELAVQRFESEVASTRALAVELEQEARGVEGVARVLVGRPGGAIARARDAELPEVATSVAAGVPTELLRNRPDLRAAELEAHAAQLDVEAARAAFFPSLQLSANVGYQAFEPTRLFATPESLVYSLVGGLVAPLVNRSQIEADFAASKAARLEALHLLQGSILRAYVEATTALHGLDRAARVVSERERGQQAARRAVELAEVLFQAGKSTYIDVLFAEQARMEADIAVVEARRTQRRTAIAVYRALGGGWRERAGSE